jgi:probable HAF family extracellular repeat protein
MSKKQTLLNAFLLSSFLPLGRVTLGSTYSVEVIMPTSDNAVGGLVDNSYLGNGGDIGFNVALKGSGKVIGGLSSQFGVILFNSSSWTSTATLGVNAEGIAVGVAGTNSGRSLPIETEFGKTSILSTTGGIAAVASAVSDNGFVAGWTVPTNGLSGDKGILWNGGKATVLTTQFGSGTQNVYVYGVNDSGTVLGSVMTTTASSDAYHPFEWTDGTTTFLPTLGGTRLAPSAINNLGVATGYATTSAGKEEAVTWSGGKINALGFLPGDVQSAAFAIDNEGDVVGESFPANGGLEHAFLCESGRMTNLNSLVPSSMGYNFLGAVGIDDYGQILAFGTYEGQSELFLLNPVSTTEVVTQVADAEPNILTAPAAVPEPGGLTMLLGGASMAAIRTRRRWTKRDGALI